MKGPTYILKNAYQEHLVDYQYQKHLTTVRKIARKIGTVHSESQKQFEKIDRMRKQKEQHRKFQEQEAELNRNYSNKSLQRKLIENDQRHLTLDLKKTKSLISTQQKLIAYEIGLENIRLGQRILNLPAVIQKQDQDKAYAKHEQNLFNATRIRTLQSKKGSRIERIEGPIVEELPIQFKLVVLSKELHVKENLKIDYLYSVEALIGFQTIQKTTPCSHEQLQSLYMRIPFTAQTYEQFKESGVKLRIWKVKFNSEILVGETFIGYNDDQKEKDLMRHIDDTDIWGGFIQL